MTDYTDRPSPLNQLDRLTQAKLALHDHGTRHVATARSVREAMRAEGFTDEEIGAAARAMKGDE